MTDAEYYAWCCSPEQVRGRWTFVALLVVFAALVGYCVGRVG